MAKLEVGDVNDPLEREADAVADRVMRMPAPKLDVVSDGPAPEPDGELDEDLEDAELSEALMVGAFAGGASLPEGPGFVAYRKCASCEAEEREDDEIHRSIDDALVMRACKTCEDEDEIRRACASCDAQEEDAIRRTPISNGPRPGSLAADLWGGPARKLNFADDPVSDKFFHWSDAPIPEKCAFAYAGQRPVVEASPCDERPRYAALEWLLSGRYQTGPDESPIRRACASCKLEGHEEIHREAAGGWRGGPTSGEFAAQLRGRVRSGGQPLPDSARSFLEPRLGVDLGHLRVHADTAAGSLAKQINARAFTIGRDIFFGSGELRPATHGGMRLLAHEVAHTLQAAEPDSLISSVDRKTARDFNRINRIIPGPLPGRGRRRGIQPKLPRQYEGPVENLTASDLGFDLGRQSPGQGHAQLARRTTDESVMVRRAPEDEVEPLPIKPRSVEVMGDDYLGAHPELVAKVETLIDDLYHHLDNTTFILDNSDTPEEILTDVQKQIKKFRQIWRTVIKHKMFDSASLSQWLDSGIRALRSLKKALDKAKKHPEFGTTATILIRDTKRLQSRAYRLKNNEFFKSGEDWVSEHGEAQEAAAREAQKKAEREAHAAKVQKGLDDITTQSFEAWLTEDETAIKYEIEWARTNLHMFSYDETRKRVWEAHMKGLQMILDGRGKLEESETEERAVLRRGGDDPLAAADAIVDIVLGSDEPNLIVLDRVLSHHWDKDYKFRSKLVMSVVRRWDNPSTSWREQAAGYAQHNPKITFSWPIVPVFAADVLIHEADGNPIMLANRSLWYISHEHERAEELLWMVRNKASRAGGELDEDFDRKFVLQLVSKWDNPSAEFRELQARYIGEGLDARRVENTFYSALGEQGEDLDNGMYGGLAAAFGADTSAIAAENLDEYLRGLPEEERRDTAKAVIARFSSTEQLTKLASSPDTRRALATLAQSLGNLTNSQHGMVWASALDPTGKFEGWAMVETDQQFEEQFLRKIVKIMAATEEPRYVIPGVDGSWGRTVNVTTKVEGTISVYINGDRADFAKTRPYFQKYPVDSTIYNIPPDRVIVLVYPGDRFVKVPAFWLVRLSELSAQQAVKTGVVVASLVVGPEELLIGGAVKLAGGISKANAVRKARNAEEAFAEAQRALGLAEDVGSHVDELAAIERGADATDGLTDVGRALSPSEVVEQGTAAEFKVAGETHHVYFGRSVNGKIELQLCSRNCAALRAKVDAMLSGLPPGHPAREELIRIRDAADEVLAELDGGMLKLGEADARAELLAKNLEILAKKHPDSIKPNIDPSLHKTRAQRWREVTQHSDEVAKKLNEVDGSTNFLPGEVDKTVGAWVDAKQSSQGHELLNLLEKARYGDLTPAQANELAISLLGSKYGVDGAAWATKHLPVTQAEGLLSQLTPKALEAIMDIPGPLAARVIHDVGIEQINIALSLGASGKLKGYHIYDLVIELHPQMAIDYLQWAGSNGSRLARVARTGDWVAKANKTVGIGGAAGAKTVILDNNARIAIDELLRGKPFSNLDSNYQQTIHGLRGQLKLPKYTDPVSGAPDLAHIVGSDADLRLTTGVAQETLYGESKTNIASAALRNAKRVDVDRTSPAYANVLEKLRGTVNSDAVGGAKGSIDRSVVADALLARSEPRVIPTLVTSDTDVLVRLAERFAVRPSNFVPQVGKKKIDDLRSTYPAGWFEIDVLGHVLKVVFN